MRWQTKAFIALAALVFSAGAAHGQGAKAGGSEAAGTPSREISGRVVQASPSKLFLEHMGAVVEFNIASDAQFSGGNLTSSRDLSEGQEVRASFTVENKTSNVVKRISLAREAGSRGAAPQPERPTPGVPRHPPGETGAPTPHDAGGTPTTK